MKSVIGKFVIVPGNDKVYQSFDAAVECISGSGVTEDVLGGKRDVNLALNVLNKESAESYLRNVFEGGSCNQTMKPLYKAYNFLLLMR